MYSYNMLVFGNTEVDNYNPCFQPAYKLFEMLSEIIFPSAIRWQVTVEACSLYVDHALLFIISKNTFIVQRWNFKWVFV